jgi:hypothetical protein
MPLSGSNFGFALGGWTRARVLPLFGLTLAACFAGFRAQAQTVAPPNMTFTCTPDPIYSGASATCTANVGGGATGSVSM